MKKTFAVLALAMTILVTGCAHKHEFSAATCTSPEICVKCGEAQGEPLGHDVDFGICRKCGDPVGVDILDQITQLTIYSPKKKSASTYYDAGKYNTCYEYFLELQNDYAKANEIAQKYPEMSSLSSVLTKVVDLEIEKSDGSNIGNIFFMSDYVDFLDLELDVFDEVKALQNLLLQ